MNPEAFVRRYRWKSLGPVAPDMVTCGAFEEGSVVVVRSYGEKNSKLAEQHGLRLTPSGPDHCVLRPGRTDA